MDVAQKSSLGKDMQTIVEVGPYRGLFGTIHSIIYEEGEKGPAADLVKSTGGAPALKAGNVGQESRRRKGQGFEGLWRGWRVGMWGLVGVGGGRPVGRRRREGWRILMVRSATANVHLQSSTVWSFSGVAWWYGTHRAIFLANLLSTLI